MCSHRSQTHNKLKMGGKKVTVAKKKKERRDKVVKIYDKYDVIEMKKCCTSFRSH